MVNGGDFLTLQKIENEIRKYTSVLLFSHDMNINRNNINRCIYNKIVNICLDTLKNSDELLNEFENEAQVRYFVRQTILYLVI
mgnify:CR=1 FL=1